MILKVHFVVIVPNMGYNKTIKRTNFKIFGG